MIGRRAFLQSIMLALAGMTLSEGAGLTASAEPFPPGLPDRFLKRASSLNYDLNDLWATFSQVKASYQSRNLAALWHVSTVPLLVIDNGQRFEVKSFSKFRRLGHIVLAARIRNAVLQCEFASLFLNSDGAMIGDGELWIKEVCKDIECRKSKSLVSTVDLFS